MKRIISIFMLLIVLVCGVSFAEEIDTDKTIKVNKYITDSIEESNEVDYFNFDLNRQGSIQIEFEFDIEGRYNVTLYDLDNDNGQIQSTDFYTNYNTPSGEETLYANKMRLPAGDYRIRVSADGYSFTDENYKIRVNYEQESKGNYEFENNNDAKSAMEIDTDETVTGNLEDYSDIDYYMFDLPYSGKVQLNFNYYYEGEYDIVLYEQSGVDLTDIQINVASTQTKPYGKELFSQTFEKMRLPAGTYYVEVSSRSFCNEDYELTVFYNIEKHGNFEEESNDTIQTATEIYNNMSYLGNLNSSRDVDIYAGHIVNGSLKIEFEIPGDASYSVYVYKETLDGKLVLVITEVVDSETRVIEIEDVNESCRYYFEVSSNEYSNEDYTIKFMNNVYTQVYQPVGQTQIDLQIGNQYMNVNGVARLIDNNGTMPVLSKGRTMLPIRAVIEALGGTIEWDANTFTTTVTIGNKNIKIKIGDKVAYVNGAAKTLDVPSQLINQRTMLPLRFIMENLGGNVTWEDATQIVRIKY